jgi:glycine cleavage system H protein
MEGFSYNNIFETKGIEYLIIIGFLLLIIPFWIFLNRQADLKIKLKNAIGILSDSLLRIPKGIFHSKGHTWAHLNKSGVALVGLDDFLVHITGELRVNSLKNPGEYLRKGEIMAEVVQNGKSLQITSPVSGTVIASNSLLNENPGILNEDPYGDGWFYSVKPNDWKSDISSYYLADEAVAWSKKELLRFKDFMAESVRKQNPGTATLILQDGGELCDRPLSELPDEVWQDFQKSFLN